MTGQELLDQILEVVTEAWYPAPNDAEISDLESVQVWLAVQSLVQPNLTLPGFPNAPNGYISLPVGQRLSVDLGKGTIDIHSLDINQSSHHVACVFSISQNRYYRILATFAYLRSIYGLATTASIPAGSITMTKINMAKTMLASQPAKPSTIISSRSVVASILENAAKLLKP